MSEQSLRSLDDLVSAGRYANRTDAVRAAVEALIAEAKRRELDAAIVQGYGRLPDAPADRWVDAATTAMISAEPW